MACPYFDPVEPRAASHGAENSMLPLGDSWSGLCRAVPDQPAPPDAATLHPLCNLGYARGACSRFPEGDGPDAVRFTIRAATAHTVDLYYVLERDHHPFAHGPLAYSPAAPLAADLLAHQARAYAESYLRRKLEAFPR